MKIFFKILIILLRYIYNKINRKMIFPQTALTVSPNVTTATVDAVAVSFTARRQ